MIAGRGEEKLRFRQGYERVALGTAFDLAVSEPLVAHLVKVASHFVVDKEIEVALVQLGQLALGEEVGRHLLG